MCELARKIEYSIKKSHTLHGGSNSIYFIIFIKILIRIDVHKIIELKIYNTCWEFRLWDLLYHASSFSTNNMISFFVLPPFSLKFLEDE